MMQAQTRQTAAFVESFEPSWFKIVGRKRETPDTYTFKLAPVEKITKPYQPGQFNMLYVTGVGEAPISISGHSKNGHLLHTVRAVGSVTKALTNAKDGTIVGLRGPYGQPWPLQEAENHDVAVIAGGIGLPPLRPAINRLLEEREKYGNVYLLYGARTPGDLLYKRDLSRWKGRLDAHVLVTVDKGDEKWRSHVGVVTTLFKYVHLDAGNTYAFVCGPEIMMKFTIMELRKQGISDDRIFISMERNMKCGVGLCGHCQLGPVFVCKHGPVFRFSDIAYFFGSREL